MEVTGPPTETTCRFSPCKGRHVEVLGGQCKKWRCVGGQCKKWRSWGFSAGTLEQLRQRRVRRTGLEPSPCPSLTPPAGSRRTILPSAVPKRGERVGLRRSTGGGFLGLIGGRKSRASMQVILPEGVK